MSTISSLGSSSTWSSQAVSRHAGGPKGPPPNGGSMPEDLFKKIDSDGDGSVNATELQSMLEQMGGSSGSSDATQVQDMLKSMDSDGSGGLSAAELGAGMAPPPPPSTFGFAQSRGGDDPVMALDADDSGGVSAQEFGVDASTSSSELKALFSAIDTDGDASISQDESQAFQTRLTDAVSQALGGAKAAGHGDGDGDGDDRGASAASASSSSDVMSQLVQRMLQQYLTQAGAGATSASQGSALSVTA